jgi:hypothetical protein
MEEVDPITKDVRFMILPTGAQVAILARRAKGDARVARVRTECEAARSVIDTLYARRTTLSLDEVERLIALLKSRADEMRTKYGIQTGDGCRMGNDTEIEHRMQTLVFLQSAAEYHTRTFGVS